MSKLPASAALPPEGPFFGDDRFEIINPATGSAFASAPVCGEIQLERAVEAAQTASPRWQYNETARRAALSACAAKIRKHANTLAALITQEQGKPLAEAKQEVTFAAEQFSQNAALAIPRSILEREAGIRALQLHKAYGVVGVIVSRDHPLAIAAAKAARALVLGNTVILKPSPHTPLSCLQLGRILNRVLPVGILTILSGGDELGALMVRHPHIRKLSISGAFAIGQAVMLDAARTLKPVALETRGNDPAIVLPGSCPEEIAPKIAYSAFANSGQHCRAIRRVYVHESCYAATIDALLQATASCRLGDGMSSDTNFGPLTTERQLLSMREYARQVGQSQGILSSRAKAPPAQGFFFRPTIASDIDSNHPLVMEEQGGPILPVIPYRYIEDAVSMANNGAPAFSASVWTVHPNLGLEVGAKLNCSRVGINGHALGNGSAPALGCSRLNSFEGNGCSSDLSEPQSLDLYPENL